MLMLMFRHQNADQNVNIKIVNKSFENLAQLKNVGTTIKSQISIHEKIRSRLNLCNAAYHLVQDLFSFVRCLKKYKLEHIKL
jgi:hypothetical protein